MKAKVQYNDFVGTSAADISDGLKLEDVLTEGGVDTERFTPVGASFFAGDTGHCHFSILCTDATRDDDKIVKVSYYKDSNFSIQNVMNMFKRFEVIVTTEGHVEKELVDVPAVYVE